MTAVSVVIPARNAERFLALALDSVLDQSQPAAEIWVVDDGSTDETPAIAQRYGDPVKLVRFEESRGASVARNVGVARSSSPFIAFLDADDVALRERLALQSERLQAVPEAAVAFCAMAYIDAAGQATGDVVTSEGVGGCGFLGRLMVRNRVGSTSAAMVRRSLFATLGGFDSGLTHNEEYELWLRIAARYDVLVDDRVLLHYRLHDANISHAAEIQRANEASVLLRFSRHEIESALAVAYPDPLDFAVALSRVLMRREEYAASEAVLIDQSKRGTKDARVSFLLGVLAQDRDDSAAAARHYRTSLALQPRLAPALNNLAVLEARAGDHATARSRLSAAMDVARNYGDARSNLELLNEGRDTGCMRVTRTLLRPVLKPLDRVSERNVCSRPSARVVP